MSTTLNLLGFHDARRHGRDMTPAANAAVERARELAGNVIITLPQGEYHFHPGHAVERFYHVSNNDPGLRRMAFPFIGLNGITLDGAGSTFILHGRLSPFVVDGASDICIRNLTVDVERPFNTQGLIMEATRDHIDLLIDRTTFPTRVEGGELIFEGDEWKVDDESVSCIMEYDPITRAPAYRAGFFLAKFRRNRKLYGDKMLDEGCCVIHAEELPNNVLRIHGTFGQVCRPGQMLVITHEKRLNAGLFIRDSHNVTMEDVTFHQAGAMGVIAQLSENITLRRVQMVPRPGSGRLLSVNADATHFVNCTGNVMLDECVFEGMMDDGGNCHGIYTTITGINGTTLELELMHFQQQGILLYRPGDRIAFIHRHLLDTFEHSVVHSATLVDPKHIRLELEAAAPEGVNVGDAVENPDRMPELHVRNCRIMRNRPRGFLVSTAKRAVIEGCEFSNCAFAIHLPGDANSWYESGAVSDVTIRNNTFRDGGYVWSYPAIFASPEWGEVSETEPPCYHRNILIENNLLESYDPAFVRARSVDGLVIRGNRYRQTRSYPAPENPKPAVEVQDCRNVTVAPVTTVDA